MAVVVAEETSDGQFDGHPVPGLQVEGHDDGGTVLLVLHVFLAGSHHHLVVDHQTRTRRQGVARGAGVTVDGEGEAVHTRAGDSEDAGVHAVAASEVDESVLVGDDPGVAEGTHAVQTLVVGECDGEGASAVWVWTRNTHWS